MKNAAVNPTPAAPELTARSPSAKALKPGAGKAKGAIKISGTANKVHDERYGALEDKEEPPTFIPLATGLELGIQFRFFGVDPGKRGSRQGQLEDEEELDLLD